MFATVPALGALCAGYAFGVEPRWFETAVQPVWIPGLGGSLRILHLSDLHASFEVPFPVISAAVAAGLFMKPDLICLTGDFITRAERLDWGEYSRILRRLSSFAPTFATLGNHDGGFWAKNHWGHRDPSRVVRLLGDSGIDLLQNEGRLVKTAKASIRLVGVGDLWAREVDAAVAFKDAAGQAPTVLLAHNPDTKDATKNHQWDLMLSGHTHGGQVLIPLVGDSFVPVRDKRFVAGLNPWDGRQIYVTRGVGSFWGIRVNCRPEVTILDLAG